MSAVKTARRRPSKKVLLIGAAAVAVALVAGTVSVIALQPQRVDPSTVTIKKGPEQVAINEPVPAAPAEAKVADVVDVTNEISETLAGDVGGVRTRVQGELVQPPVSQADNCLRNWAKENLASLARKGTYDVVDVCGRPTAVLAGAGGADSKVLAYGALEKSAPAAVKQLVAESKGNRIAVAGVRSSDQKASLLAVALLPSVTETAADGTTQVVHTPPPGFAPYPGDLTK